MQQLSSFPRSGVERCFRMGERVVRCLRSRVGSSSRFDRNREDRGRCLKYCEGVFGKDRFHRAIKAAGLSSSHYQERPFSKEELQAIFPRLLLLRYYDYLELFQELVGESESRESLRNSSHGNSFSDVKSLDQCSLKHLKILDRLLLPFSSTEEAFLGFSVDKNVSLLGTEKCAERGWRYTAYIVDRLRRKWLSQRRWEVFVAKTLFRKYRLPEGSVLRSFQGYLLLRRCYDKEEISLSELVPFCRSVTKKPSFRYMILPGTGNNPSLREDFTNELAAPSVMTHYDAIRDMVTKSTDPLVVLGYSLGGAQAQRIAILFCDHVMRVVTVSSPGIEKKSVQLVSDHSSRVLRQIVHHFDQDDMVPQAGEAHLGYGISDCSIQIFMHGTGEVERSFWPPSRSLWYYVLCCFRPFVEAHLRLPKKKFRWTSSFVQPHQKRDQKIDHSTVVQKILGHNEKYCNPSFERLRQRIASKKRLISSGFKDFCLSKRKVNTSS